MLFSAFSGFIDKQINVTLKANNDGLVDLQPVSFEFTPTSSDLANITIIGRSPGHVEITASAAPENTTEYEMK